MRTLLLRFALVLFWVFGSSGAALGLPVTLTLVPSTVSLLPGQTLSVDIVVGGLTEPAGEIALESFDLDLEFDTTRLTFDSLSFGPSLGTAAQTARSGPGTPNVSGVVVMGEFSFLSEAALLALQSAPFVLATIDFEALNNPGDALLELINLAGDSLGGVSGRALGNELQAPSSLSVNVPEPAAGTLLVAALALFWRRERRTLRT